MAKMMQCPTCKKSISMEAPACPKCGQPITDEDRAVAEAKKKKAGIGCLVIIALVGLLILLGSLGEKTQPPASTPTPRGGDVVQENDPAKRIEGVIAKASGRPEKIEVFQRTNGLYGAVVTLKATDAWSGSSYVRSTLMDIENILKALAKSGLIPTTEEIGFFVNAKMKDKYGNDSSDVLFKTYFKSAELNKVNWNNTHIFLIANIANRVVSYQPGARVLAEFCKENLDDARDFCKTVTKN